MQASQNQSSRTDFDHRAKRGVEDQLARLSDVGHRIIEALAAHLAALAGPARFVRMLDLEDVFDRVGWALRLIVALRLKLTREAEAPGRSQPAEPLGGGEAEPREMSERESGDRFDFDGFGAILKRPVDEVIAIICDALGATPEWRRWAEAACAGEPIADDEDDALAAEALDRPRWSRRDALRRSRLARAAPS